MQANDLTNRKTSLDFNFFDEFLAKGERDPVDVNFAWNFAPLFRPILSTENQTVA